MTALYVKPVTHCTSAKLTFFDNPEPEEPVCITRLGPSLEENPTSPRLQLPIMLGDTIGNRVRVKVRVRTDYARRYNR